MQRQRGVVFVEALGHNHLEQILGATSVQGGPPPATERGSCEPLHGSEIDWPICRWNHQSHFIGEDHTSEVEESNRGEIKSAHGAAAVRGERCRQAVVVEMVAVARCSAGCLGIDRTTANGACLRLGRVRRHALQEAT